MRALLARVRSYRQGRTRLHRDDKVLTAWNGLMIAALARAGLVLEEPCYLEAAQRAAAFIRRELTGADGGLLARWREGRPPTWASWRTMRFMPGVCWSSMGHPSDRMLRGGGADGPAAAGGLF